MRHLAAMVALVALVAIGPTSGIAWAQPARLIPLPQLGQTRAQVEELIAAGDWKASWVPRERPQALREALLDTGALETFHRLKAAIGERAQPKWHPLRAGSFLTMQRGPQRAVVAFGDEEMVRFVFLAASVPVDSSKDAVPGRAKTRLHRLRTALDDLQRTVPRLDPWQKDRRGNVFSWKGRRGRGVRVAAFYLPEADELRTVWF